MKPFEIKIERMIPGGKGIAFLDKRAIFAPLVVPGDRVRVKQALDRGSYLEVLEGELVEASSDRQQPPCQYFGRCGGCDFQQMNDQRQLDSKAEILADALMRVGKIRGAEIRISRVPSPPSAYRNRLQLKVLPQNGRVSWGFFQRASHQVIEVDRCWVATDSLWSVLPKLQAFLERSPLTLNSVTEVEIFQGDGRETLIDVKVKPDTTDFLLLKNDLLAGPFDWGGRTVSLYLSRSQKRTLRVLGPGYVYKTVGAWRYRISRGSFFQVNDFMLETLKERATQGVGGSMALDLYCGVGFFTLSLAAKFRQVVAVDQNPSAILDLKKNMHDNGFRNCRVSYRELDTFLRVQRRELKDVDLVLLDPPRSGVPRQTVRKVAELQAPKVIYVSCDPSTLARDLAIFLGQGYTVESLEILDLFPQSHHLETVARLGKGSSRQSVRGARLSKETGEHLDPQVTLNPPLSFYAGKCDGVRTLS